MALQYTEQCITENESFNILGTAGSGKSNFLKQLQVCMHRINET